MQQRKELVMILISNDEGSLKFHFTTELSRTDQDIDLWFPLSYRQNLFAEVEAVLWRHGIANHVVSIESIRTMGNCTDYKVRYVPAMKSIVIHGVTVVQDVSVLSPSFAKEIPDAFNHCKSKDEVLNYLSEACPTCFGFGSLPVVYQGAEDRQTCKHCLGTGSLDPLTCIN